ISQFAPRGQTVKDKAIYTSVGVVGYERKGPRVEPIANPLFSPAKAGLCRTCQALTTQDVVTCPVCGEGRSEKFAVHDLSEPPGPIIKRALASITTTDVVLIGIDEERVPAGIAVRPTTLVARAAWYSLGFPLRGAASKLLDVDVNELDVGLRVFAESGVPRAE